MLYINRRACQQKYVKLMGKVGVQGMRNAPRIPASQVARAEKSILPTLSTVAVPHIENYSGCLAGAECGDGVVDLL